MRMPTALVVFSSRLLAGVPALLTLSPRLFVGLVAPLAQQASLPSTLPGRDEIGSGLPSREAVVGPEMTAASFATLVKRVAAQRVRRAYAHMSSSASSTMPPPPMEMARVAAALPFEDEAETLDVVAATDDDAVAFGETGARGEDGAAATPGLGGVAGGGHGGGGGGGATGGGSTGGWHESSS